jgi:hypothetical protein
MELFRNSGTPVYTTTENFKFMQLSLAIKKSIELR